MGLHIGFSYRPATVDCMENAGQRIRRLRKAMSPPLTQADLALKLGVDQSTVSDIERGAGFSADLLMKIAQALETTPAMLMVGHDEATWPFKRVPLERFVALQPEDRAFVEGRLAQALNDVSEAPSQKEARRKSDDSDTRRKDEETMRRVLRESRQIGGGATPLQKKSSNSQ